MFKFFAKQAAQRAKQFGESAEDCRRPTRTRLLYYVRQPGFWFEAVASILFIVAFTVMTSETYIPVSEWITTFVFFGVIFMLYQYCCLRSTSTRTKTNKVKKQ